MAITMVPGYLIPLAVILAGGLGAIMGYYLRKTDERQMQRRKELRTIYEYVRRQNAER